MSRLRSGVLAVGVGIGILGGIIISGETVLDRGPEVRADSGGWHLEKADLTSEGGRIQMEEFLSGMDPECNVQFQMIEITGDLLFLYACP